MVRPATPRDRLLERIKAWARGEFLKPLTDVAEEPARFDEDTLYLAAVLCAMADMGLWAAHQRATVDTFSLSGFDLNKWRQARARGDEYPLFLVLTKERTEAEPRVQSTPTLPTGATAGLILDLPLPATEQLSIICIELSTSSTASGLQLEP
jgi:hypothetical protein